MNGAGGIVSCSGLAKGPMVIEFVLRSQPKLLRLFWELVDRGVLGLAMHFNQKPGLPINPILAPLTLFPPPPCISYALVQATVGVGTVMVLYVI